MPPMPSKYFDIAGYAVSVLHAPPSTLPGVVPALARGKRLVFLHGAGSTAAVWRRQLTHFAARHSPLAFDWPGHGRSSGTEALPSIPAYSDFTLALLDRLGLERAVLVGTSMGGVIALDVALRAPGRVEALVATSTAAKVSLPAELVETWRSVMNGRSAQPFTPFGYGEGASTEILREGWELQVRTDPRVRYFDLVLAQKIDLRARLGEIRQPTLVVHGAQDPIIPASEGAALAEGIAAAQYVEIPRAGHFPYREAPEAFHAAVDAFLETLP